MDVKIKFKCKIDYYKYQKSNYVSKSKCKSIPLKTINCLSLIQFYLMSE